MAYIANLKDILSCNIYFSVIPINVCEEKVDFPLTRVIFR